MRNSAERYDLIIFAFPDSLTLVNASGNLRVEPHVAPYYLGALAVLLAFALLLLA